MSYNPIKVLHIFGVMDRGGAETLIVNTLGDPYSCRETKRKRDDNL